MFSIASAEDIAPTRLFDPALRNFNNHGSARGKYDHFT